MSSLWLGAIGIWVAGALRLVIWYRAQRREIARLRAELARHRVWVAYKSESPVRLAVRRAQ